MGKDYELWKQGENNTTSGAYYERKQYEKLRVVVQGKIKEKEMLGEKGFCDCEIQGNGSVAPR